MRENNDGAAFIMAAGIVKDLRGVLMSVFAALYGRNFTGPEDVPDQETINVAYRKADSKVREIMLRATYEIEGEIGEIGNAEGLRQFYLNVLRETVKVLEDAEVTDKQDA